MVPKMTRTDGPDRPRHGSNTPGDPATDRVPLSWINAAEAENVVARCGGFFEHSPWIVRHALAERPFATLDAFHRACMATIAAAGTAEREALIAAHPDLVGRLAREGRLTRESTAEQEAAGLTALTPDEVEAFERYNAAYRDQFGFPFVICARRNRKEAILAAFPERLKHDRDEEVETAIREIGEIAWLRMSDAVVPSA
jgi:2-oxo-4-hydroxy-4-carboxy-5-ureidoimidazoline decarboxylase